MKNRLFGARIEPRCEYCANGQPSADGKMILCPRRGIVPVDSSCRRFKYDPLLRIPRRAPALPVFTEDDFSLEDDNGLVL